MHTNPDMQRGCGLRARCWSVGKGSWLTIGRGVSLSELVIGTHRDTHRQSLWNRVVLVGVVEFYCFSLWDLFWANHSGKPAAFTSGTSSSPNISSSAEFTHFHPLVLTNLSTAANVQSISLLSRLLIFYLVMVNKSMTDCNKHSSLNSTILSSDMAEPPDYKHKNDMRATAHLNESIFINTFCKASKSNSTCTTDHAEEISPHQPKKK